MGIFSRLADIVNSNINAILDRAEDPEKIIRLIIQEMEDTLVEVRSAAVRTIAEKKEMERRVEALRREHDEWQRRAELALTSGREDLAKGALAAKARVAEALAARGAPASRSSPPRSTSRTRTSRKLQAKLADAKAREKAIAARHKTAAARISLRTHLYDERITDAFARFEQVERALDEMEGKVEAFDLGRKPALADEFAGHREGRARRGGARGLEGAARQPHQAGLRTPMMHGVFGFVLGIIFLAVVAPIWIIAHYLARWRAAAASRPATSEAWASSTTSRAAWRARRSARARARRRGAGLAHPQRETDRCGTTPATASIATPSTACSPASAPASPTISASSRIAVRLAFVLALVPVLRAGASLAYIVLAIALPKRPPALFASGEDEAFWRGVATAPDDTLQRARATASAISRRGCARWRGRSPRPISTSTASSGIRDAGTRRRVSDMPRCPMLLVLPPQSPLDRLRRRC